jgi:hypothetical protein
MPHAAAGRPRSKLYRLMPPHPLATVYCLKRRDKIKIPILAGDAPPRPPPAVDTPGTLRLRQYKSRAAMSSRRAAPVPAGRGITRARARKQAEHVAYHVALLVPWVAAVLPTDQPGFATGAVFDASTQSFRPLLEDTNLAAIWDAWQRSLLITTSPLHHDIALRRGRMHRLRNIDDAHRVDVSTAKMCQGYRNR